MADKDRKPKRKGLNVFFLNGKLHKKLRIVRPEDKIEAWCYPDKRRVVLTYSEVKKHQKPAFSTNQVAEMLGRNPKVVERTVRAGAIEPPQMMYTLTKRMYNYGYRWSEEDIMAFHSYLINTHRGRPRRDGKITPQGDLPTAMELRAMIRQERVFYVRDDDGNFYPTWRAPDFS